MSARLAKLRALPEYPGHSRFLPYLLNRATDLLNARFERELRRRRVTLTQWRVLAFLSEQEGLGVSALAERIATDQSTLSRALARMETSGWIQRRASAEDSRAVQVLLTARGFNLFARILPVALQLQQAALTGLSAAELDTLSHSLSRIAENMRG